AGATGYQWKRNRLVSGTVTEDAENGLDDFTAKTSPGYSVLDHTVQSAGQSSFHLAQPAPEAQFLTLKKTLRAGPTTQLAFSSRLSWATSKQAARVQISLDSGNSWQDIWSQAGTGGSGDILFFPHFVPLSTYTGQGFNLRIVYDYLGG